jgi:hypothetical protein
MGEDTKKRPVQIDVHIADDLTHGDYINMARVFHNQSEFVLDALFLPPGSKRASVRSRLIMSPIHAKFLQAALAKNIQLYEKQFGVIQAKGGGPAGGDPILH